MGSNSNNSQTHYHNTSSANVNTRGRENSSYPSQHDYYPRASHHPSWQSAQASGSDPYPYLEHSAVQSTSRRTRLASMREDGHYSQPAKRARVDYTSVSLLKQLTRELNPLAKEVVKKAKHPDNKKDWFTQQTNDFSIRIQQLLTQIQQQKETELPGCCLNGFSSLGKLARAGCLTDAFALSLIDYYFEHSDSKLTPDKRVHTISTYFYSLGLLAQAKKLSGDFTRNTINFLLQELNSHNVNAQAISNSLYGIGLLARAGQLKGQGITSATIDNLLTRLQASNAESQNISNTLYGIGLLAETGQLKGQGITSKTVDNLLNRLQTAHPKPQEISNSLYGIGLLAKAGRLKGQGITSATIDHLLNRLKNARLQGANTKSQDISQSLYGIGLLAEAGQLKGQDITGATIDHLLNRLQEANPTPQEISNSLYGIGLLAKAGRLKGQDITGATIDHLLNRLQGANTKSQEISQSLYGIGLLAETGQLKGQGITSATIDNLLNRLQTAHPKPQEISNSLYGIGLLAKAGLLKGQGITGATIDHLLTRLQEANPTLQEISNSLYGIGLLAREGRLKGEGITGATINDLLTCLQETNTKSQDISQSLYGIGLLAEAGRLKGQGITSKTVDNLLTRLQTAHPKPQEISNSLYGIGLLAKAGQLKGLRITSATIDHLLTRLQEANATPQQISNSLYGIGLLAKAGQLEGQGITSATLDNLLTRLQGANPKPQDISQSFYGIGLLAKAGRLKGLRITSATLNNLLTRLQDININSQAISNSLYGLSMLHQQHSMTLDSTVLCDLASRVVSAATPRTACIVQLFYSMSRLHKGNMTTWLEHKTFKLALQKLENTYLHPLYTAKIVIALAQIAAIANNAAVNKLRQRLNSELKPTLDLLPADIRAELEKVNWDTNPVLHAAPLSQSDNSMPISGGWKVRKGDSVALRTRALPTHPTPRLTTSTANSLPPMNNALYNAIEKKDKNKLDRLLPIPLPDTTPRESTITSRNRVQPGLTAASHQESTNQRQSKIQFEKAILIFFALPVQPIQRLAATQINATYFNRVLHHVTQHGFYQLVKEHQLNPVLLHLPSQALNDFLAFLNHRKQLYRDHQALLTVIDALTLRVRYNPHEKENCLQQQRHLLERAIAFHKECNHQHVLARLNRLQTNLCACLLALPQEIAELTENAPATRPESSIRLGQNPSTLWQQPSRIQRDNRGSVNQAASQPAVFQSESRRLNRY